MPIPVSFFRLFIPVLSLMVFCHNVLAETCPAASEIIERKISKLYEWSVDENTSLDDLLSINKLYSVRIHNKGEFVSCTYTAREWPVRLDAGPEISDCSIETSGGDWKETGDDGLVCQEKNLYSCEFKIACADVESD